MKQQALRLQLKSEPMSLLQELEQQKEIALSNYRHASKNKDIAAEQMYQSEAATVIIPLMNDGGFRTNAHG